MIPLREAKVVAVDITKYTVDVQLSRTEGTITSVPFASAAVSRDGSWMGYMPKVGDWCLLAYPDNSKSKVYAIAFYPLATAVPADEANSFSDSAERDNYAYGRADAASGDKGMWTGIGGCISLRAGGSIDLCVSEMCWSRYFPDQNAIKTNCANWDLHGWWGSIVGEVDRAESTDLEGSAPTRLKSRVRSRSDQAPTVWVDSGTILGEEKTVLNGVPNQDPTAISQVCYRLLVYDQQTANGYAALRQEPPPEQARFSLKIDKEGNVQVASAGMVDVVVKRMAIAVEERVYAQIRGTLDILAQSAKIVTEGKITIRGRDEAVIQTEGDLYLRARRVIIDAQNDVNKIKGPWGVDADGSIELKSKGTVIHSATQDRIVSIGQTDMRTVGGRSDTTVMGAGESEWIGRDVPTWRRRIKAGSAVIHTERGSIDLKLGPPIGPPLSRIRIVSDTRLAPFIGRVEIVSGPLQNRVVVDPNGSWMVGNVISSIRYNSTVPGGSVQVGPEVGLAGYVVTSTSHRDYMTGLPLMGSPTMSVVSLQPGVPIPALPPVPSPIATPFLPEEPVS
jgi:hypothetical protein